MTAPAPPAICAKCHAGRVAAESGRCRLCGFRSGSGGTAIPETVDLEVRKELRKDFHIDRALGRGGMSVVYLAHEAELGRQLAVKVLPLHVTLEHDAVDRFKREARIAASLDHPHIVPVHRVGSTPRFLWYAMKWVRGRSIQQMIHEQGRLGINETLSVLEAVAGALMHAHQRGIVHRDIKPANILIDENGWVHVCDFGIAKAFGQLSITQTGSSIGTPGYMSPEQCYGRPLDPRSDQYAFAIFAYECLAGTPPFVADSLAEIVQKHTSQPAPAITDLRPEVPPEMSDAIQRGMAKEPDDRFEDVIQFVKAMGGEPVSAAPARSSADLRLAELASAPTLETPHAANPRTRRRNLAVAGTALAALVVAVFLLSQGGSGATLPVTATPAAEAAAPAAAEAAPVDVALLSLNSRPVGTVYLDGRRLGETPLLDLEVPAGRHELRIERSGYEPYLRQLELAAGQRQSLTDITLTPIR